LRCRFHSLVLTGGQTGVFDIEELVELLRRDNAENIFVCSVPKEIKYVDFMCIVSGRSHRHMLAMAEFVRKVFKLKRASSDILPRIEGEKSKEWMALDLGNIALHIFSPGTRKIYDLESLWSLGAEFDAKSNEPAEPLIELYERHSRYLDDLKPKSSSEMT
jgi:ribosome silencing factor RsfS/YbeB/iojap